MTIDTTKLRELAQKATYTGGWYYAGCNTVHCDYSNDDGYQHDEVAHPVPLGCAEFIAAANPAVVLSLLEEIDRLSNTYTSDYPLITVELCRAAIEFEVDNKPLSDLLRKSIEVIKTLHKQRDFYDRGYRECHEDLYSLQQTQESLLRGIANCRNAFGIGADRTLSEMMLDELGEEERTIGKMATKIAQDIRRQYEMMRSEIDRLNEIKSAAENLKKAKGRHNSEIAMNKLLEVLK